MPGDRVTGPGDRSGPGFAAVAPVLAAALSVLVPFVASVLYVNAYGVDVFYADEWDLVTLLRNEARGAFSIADLFDHHNEHVYLFPWSLMLIAGRFTGYDTVPMMLVVVCCLLVTSLGILWAYTRSVARSPFALLLFVPLPFLVFSLRQHENMLWGNQVSFAFAQTFSVLALCLLFAAGEGRRAKLLLAAAVLCATVASYSAAPGLLAWPAGLLLLLAHRETRSLSRWVLAGVWVLFGVMVWGGYLAGTEGSVGPTSPTFVLDHPAAGATYLLILNGGSLFWQEGSAHVGGLLLVFLDAAAVALVLGLRRVRENALWLALLAYALMSLTLITAGRSEFGEEVFAQATLSRYAAFSIPGVVALYGVLANLSLNARSRIAAILLGVLLVAVLTGTFRSYQLGLEAGRETEQSRRAAVRILNNHESEPLAAFTIFGHYPRRVQKYARFLDRHDYGVFAESSPNGAAIQSGHAEARSRP